MISANFIWKFKIIFEACFNWLSNFCLIKFMLFSFKLIIFIHLCFKKHYFNRFEFFVTKKVLLNQLYSKVGIVFGCFYSSNFRFIPFDFVCSLLHFNELLLCIEWIFEEANFIWDFSFCFCNNSIYTILCQLPRI